MHGQRDGVMPAGFDVRLVPTGTPPAPAAPGRRGDHGAPAGSPQNPGGPILRESSLAKDRGEANPQPPKS